MLFTSLGYAVLLAIVFLGYYLIFPGKWRWVLLLASSIYFYYSWNGFFLVIITISILIDFIIGNLIHKHDQKVIRKSYLWVSIVSNLGLLGLFKYYDFFISNLNNLIELVQLDFRFQEISLPFPVGISFYTFQTLSYTIDIYKGYRIPEKNLGKFSLYVLFFPQLLAGPIERSRKLLPQFDKVIQFNYNNVVGGLRLILWGVFKKVVIADRIGEFIDAAYNSPAEYHGWPLIISSSLFSIQIFCDFSGYTDIAIGSARIFGIKLSKNFSNRPYFASSYTNFWKGWHLTLTEWFRDYLFFTIVGKSRSTVAFYTSILLTFCLTGLWHGAGWGFIVWGCFQGIMMITERITYNSRMSLFRISALLKWPRLLYFLSATCIFFIGAFSSIWFRSVTWMDSINNLGYSLEMSTSNLHYLVTQDTVILVVLILVMDLINVKMKEEDFDQFVRRLAPVMRWGLYLILIQLILVFGRFDNIEFYYFRF